MYPLRFDPIFRQYIWGGRRLETHLGKSIGPEGVYAESWEIVDHGSDQSVVRFGVLKSRTLHQLILDFGIELLGEKVFRQITDPRLPDALQNRFPLLFKFLDANQTLSVQVHPDDDLASLNEPPDLGKTEAWYVIDAEPNALIYAGLKHGVDSEQLSLAAEAGETESVLSSFHPQAGDCVFIPAGAIHAIGEGLLVAEIQQSSDTTFRLFDWNRVDNKGQPRELHIDEAVHSTNYNLGPVKPEKPKTTEHENSMQLVKCKKFVMNRWQSGNPVKLSGNDRFRIIAVTRGELEIGGDPAELPLTLGETALLPACLKQIELIPSGDVEFLEIYVP